MTNPTSTAIPYEWLKQIPSSLLQLEETPLLGFSPQFDWENFSKALAQVLKISSLKIQPSPPEWRASDRLLNGFGDQVKFLYINIPSLEGSLCWVMSEKDIQSLMSLLLAQQEISFVDKEFMQGFYHFLGYEVIQCLSKLKFDPTLSLNLQSKTEQPNQTSLCIDIQIVLAEKTLSGRLILSPEFRRSWKEHYANRTLSASLKSPVAEKLQVIVNLIAGRTSLKRSEWKEIAPGDFLILDQCTLLPQKEKGRILLSIHNIPFFWAQMKEGTVKILEQATYQEVEAIMGNKFEDDEEELEHDSELEEETEEEYEETSGEFTEESFIEEEFTEEPSEIEEEEEISEIEEKKELSKEVPPPQTQPVSIPPKELKKVEAKQATLEELPLSIIVEVGRIEMSVQKIMELQPGNVLELGIKPENGVDLIVNGRRIAKGELLLIGETIGVRILDIG